MGVGGSVTKKGKCHGTNPVPQFGPIQTWSLVALNGDTGLPITSYQLPASNETILFSCQGESSQQILRTNETGVSNALVGRDGVAVFNSVVRNKVFVAPCGGFREEVSPGVTLSLVRLAADGSAVPAAYHTISALQTSGVDDPADPVDPIPDGQGGILAPWYIPGVEVHITDVSGSGADSIVPLQAPQVLSPAQPVSMVLGENGNFFATDGITVAAFNQGLEPLWTWNSGQTNVQLANASDGGGIAVKYIAASGGDVLVRLDSFGVASTDSAISSTGASVLTPNDIGDAFWGAASVGLVSLATNLDLAISSYAAPPPKRVAGEDFPQLKSCNDDGVNPPCPREAIFNALKDLTNKVSTKQACSAAAQTAVFSKFQDANGFPMSTTGFLNYLQNRSPRFFDGTTSTWPFVNALCGPRPGFAGFLLSNVNCTFTAPGSGITIANEFASSNQPSAITQTPSYPLLVFFRPTDIVLTSNGANVSNEALLFHEILHGITGLEDDALQSVLLGPSGVGQPTVNIDNYIETNVLGNCN